MNFLENKMKALKMALEFILLNITSKNSLRQGYGLSFDTLSRIENSEPIRSATAEKYMSVFVEIIYDYRSRYREDSPRRKSATDFMMDLLLVCSSGKSEKERVKREVIIL